MCNIWWNKRKEGRKRKLQMNTDEFNEIVYYAWSDERLVCNFHHNYSRHVATHDESSIHHPLTHSILSVHVRNYEYELKSISLASAVLIHQALAHIIHWDTISLHPSTLQQNRSKKKLCMNQHYIIYVKL